MKNLFYFLIFIGLNLYSQSSSTNYSYYSDTEIQNLSDKLKNNIKTFQSSYDNYKKELVKTSKQTHKYIETSLKDSSFIKQKEITNYLSKIINEIKKANPDIDNINDFIFLISNDHIANAASYNFNFFEINLGLIFLYENEDELAFTICHEIAHQQLKHFEKSVISKKNIQTKNSKKLEKANSNERVRLRKNMLYENSLISQKHESEADSLGMVYFSKTKYHKEEAYSSLNKLGSAEELTYNSPTHWKKDYGFDYDSIITSNKIFNNRILDNEFKIATDSIRTHPNIKKRVSELGGIYQKQRSPSNYSEKQLIALDCFINYAAIHKNYTASFYINNMLHTKYPDDKKYIENLINIIDKVYKLKKQHKLGLYVQNINNISKEIYLNQIRSFFREAELYELKNTKTFLINKLNQ